MRGALALSALLRYERLRWQTGWSNALHAPDRATRFRVLRSLLGAAIVAGALVWVASHVLGGVGAGEAPAGALLQQAAALALLFSLALVADGARVGALGPDSYERWFAAVGVSGEALAARRLVLRLLRFLPYVWVPLLATAEVAMRKSPLEALLLAGAGLGFALLGHAAGTLARGAARRGAVALALLLVGLFAGTIWGVLGTFALVRVPHGWVEVVTAPWLWLLGSGGALAVPFFVLGAGAIAYFLVRREVQSAGWARQVSGRSYGSGASGMRASSPVRILLGREVRRVGHLNLHDALGLGLLAAGTIAMYVAGTFKPDRGMGMLGEGGAPLTAFFSLLIPAIMFGELVWGRERAAFWSYLRATGGSLPASVLAHAGAHALALLGWVLFLLVSLGATVGWVGGLGRFAGLGLLLCLAAAGGSAAGSTLALRSGASGSSLGQVLRLGGVVLGLAAPALAAGVWGSMGLAVLLCAAVVLLGLWGAWLSLARMELSASSS